MPESMVVKVLTPLCRQNLAKHLPEWAEPSKHGGPESSLNSLAWSVLHAAGFKVFTCFIRGGQGHEEICVVLPEGSVSWPVRQLVPATANVLEVHDL